MICSICSISYHQKEAEQSRLSPMCSTLRNLTWHRYGKNADFSPKNFGPWEKTLKDYKHVLKKPINGLNQRKSPKISKKKLAKTITGPKKLALMFLHNLRVFPSLLLLFLQIPLLPIVGKFQNIFRFQRPGSTLQRFLGKLTPWQCMLHVFDCLIFYKRFVYVFLFSIG